MGLLLPQVVGKYSLFVWADEVVPALGELLIYSLWIDSLVVAENLHAMHKYYLTIGFMYFTGPHKYALKFFSLQCSDSPLSFLFPITFLSSQIKLSLQISLKYISWFSFFLRGSPEMGPRGLDSNRWHLMIVATGPVDAPICIMEVAKE